MTSWGSTYRGHGPVDRPGTLLLMLLMLLLLSLLLAHAGPVSAMQVQHLEQAEMLVTPASQARPLTSAFDAATLPGQWAAVSLPHRFVIPAMPALPEPGTRPGMATVWYRLVLPPLPATREEISLHLLRWQAAGRLAVYGDGKLLYRSRGTPTWNHFRHPALFIPLRDTPEEALPRTLLIRLDIYPGATGALSSLYVGESADIYPRYVLREWLEYQLPFMMSAAFLAVGLFSFCVWLVRRHEPIYLLVFVIAVCNITRRWHFYASLEMLPVSDQWFGWLTYNALNWQIVALQFFFLLLHKRDHRWFNRGMVGFSLIMSVATLPLSSLQPGMVLLKPMLYVGPILFAIVMVVRNVIDSWRSRSLEACLLAAWMTASLLFGIYDWFKVKNQFDIEGFYLTPYSSMMMFVVILYILFRRYVQAIAEAERGRQTLAIRLSQRETELAESYERLREVEKAQTLSMERQRMMQDMHDVLGLSLIGALRRVEHGKLDEHEVAQILSACIDDLKLAIDSLEPVDADLLLLLATLRFRLGSRLDASGITLLWQVDTVPPLPWLDPRHALHILRILQEALGNIIKHTGASEIAVSTQADAHGVQVQVRDNGGGFDLQQGLARGGKGLRNQMRRAEAIGARIEWKQWQQGTLMILHLPLVQ